MARMSGYKAITTKYIGPTDRRGARVKADDGDGNTITANWMHSTNADENHCAAADALAIKMNWSGELVGGSTKDGYVFVFIDK